VAHFGLICPSFADGHLNTMLPLGVELQKRGHKATLLGVLDAQEKTMAAGVGFKAISESEFPKGWFKQYFEKLSQTKGSAAIKLNFEREKTTGVTFYRDAPNAIKEIGIDALLIDQMYVFGSTVAEHLQIPFISICSSLPLNYDESVPSIFTHQLYKKPGWGTRLRNRVEHFLGNLIIGRPILQIIAQYREQWQLSPCSHYPNDTFSQLAQITQTPKEFEFPRKALPQCFHFTGPFHYSVPRQPIPFPFEKLTGEPLIYASMGTVYHHIGLSHTINLFKTIAEACLGLNAQLVISLGGAFDPNSLPKLPGLPLVVDYAPQLELLKKASLTITHAGINTVLESLNNAVPMVAIPITNDQPGTGTRIVWSGTGEVIRLDRLNVAILQATINKVMTEEPYKKNALRLQEALHRAGGVNRAVDIIEQAVSTGKPVLS
jgi:zeaxanthin glucosyltransferase